MPMRAFEIPSRGLRIEGAKPRKKPPRASQTPSATPLRSPANSLQHFPSSGTAYRPRVRTSRSNHSSPLVRIRSRARTLPRPPDDGDDVHRARLHRTRTPPPTRATSSRIIFPSPIDVHTKQRSNLRDATRVRFPTDRVNTGGSRSRFFESKILARVTLVARASSSRDARVRTTRMMCSRVPRALRAVSSVARVGRPPSNQRSVGTARW